MKSSKDVQQFHSIVDLLLVQPVTHIVTAIEREGFYSWDRFGRFVKVPPVKDSPENAGRDRILELIASLVRFDGAEYHYTEEDILEYAKEPTSLSMSGWWEAALPLFDKLYANWEKEQHGTDSLPGVAPKGPYKMPAVLAGLIQIKYGEEFLNDLKSPHSNKIGERGCK